MTSLVELENERENKDRDRLFNDWLTVEDWFRSKTKSEFIYHLLDEAQRSKACHRFIPYHGWITVIIRVIASRRGRKKKKPGFMERNYERVTLTQPNPIYLPPDSWRPLIHFQRFNSSCLIVYPSGPSTTGENLISSLFVVSHGFLTPWSHNADWLLREHTTQSGWVVMSQCPPPCETNIPPPSPDVVKCPANPITTTMNPLLLNSWLKNLMMMLSTGQGIGTMASYALVIIITVMDWSDNNDKEDKQPMKQGD